MFKETLVEDQICCQKRRRRIRSQVCHKRFSIAYTRKLPASVMPTTSSTAGEFLRRPLCHRGPKTPEYIRCDDVGSSTPNLASFFLSAMPARNFYQQAGYETVTAPRSIYPCTATRRRLRRTRRTPRVLRATRRPVRAAAATFSVSLSANFEPTTH